jgi:hypothetical protein
MKGLDDKLIRRQTPEWRALHRDIPTAVALLTVIAAGIINAVALFGLFQRPPISTPHASPIFWLILILFIWWVPSFTEYRPRPIKRVKIMAVVNIPASVILTSAALETNHPSMSLYYGASGLVVVLTIVSYIAYGRSVLKKTGPWRLPEDGPAGKPQ